jgi:hypothetical protein
MSARNGDKSRFGRMRKQKVARRARTRELKAAMAPQGDAEKETGVLGDAAKAIGSALGTIAAKTKRKKG